jgi:hypothetical protein
MAKPLVIFGNAEIAALAKFYFTHDSDYTAGMLKGAPAEGRQKK